jgi:hypothetical protein
LKRAPTPTKRERKELAKATEQARRTLIARDIALAPLLHDLLAGRGTDALLVHPTEPYRPRMIHSGRGRNARAEFIGSGTVNPGMLQSCAGDMRLRFLGTHFAGGQPVYVEPGGRLLIENAAVDGFGRVERCEIAVDCLGGTTSARVSTSDSAVVSAVRHRPTDKYAEQEKHGHLVARALTSVTRRRYVVRAEHRGSTGALDEPTDVLLVPLHAGFSERVALQMRHLSEIAAEDLGTASGTSQVQLTIDTVKRAIAAKGEGHSTHDLVLIVPAPIGDPFRDRLVAEGLDPHGWRRLWLSEAGAQATRLA